ncbi:MAG: hypothetical protein HYW50_02780 [Candidatus Diapherotrites archaeon]|nr:hypothetical protein [Candidatus Diapherotrites archaeon]
MDIIQASLFKLAIECKISEKELKVLNCLRKKELDFLEISKETGLELPELREILSVFEKKKVISQKGGKYFFSELEALNQLIAETQTIKELA